jgi:hypothetical protein
MWRYEMAKWRETLVCWIVWHLPRSLVYWATIRLFAHATTGRWGSETPDSVTIWTALKRWERVPDNRRIVADRYPDPVTDR